LVTVEFGDSRDFPMYDVPIFGPKSSLQILSLLLPY